MKNPLVQGLMWRAALKSFSPVPNPLSVNIQPVLDAIQLAPSAYGVQPYYVHVITDAPTKEELRKVSYNQAQVTECSHLLIFAASDNGKLSADRFIRSCNIEAEAPDFAQFLHRTYDEQSPDVFLPWAVNQAYIALGVGICAAAQERIGSCPMSGLVPADVKRVLNLPADQHPVAYLALGSTLDDEAWHAESRKTFPRRRIQQHDLFHWRPEKPEGDAAPHLTSEHPR